MSKKMTRVTIKANQSSIDEEERDDYSLSNDT